MYGPAVSSQMERKEIMDTQGTRQTIRMIWRCCTGVEYFIAWLKTRYRDITRAKAPQAPDRIMEKVWKLIDPTSGTIAGEVSNHTVFGSYDSGILGPLSLELGHV